MHHTELFDRVWDRLADQGQCDARGGIDYQHMRALWFGSGHDEALAAWLEDNWTAPSVRTANQVEDEPSPGPGDLPLSSRQV